MDYGFSEAQEMFRKSVRDFLEKECPRKLVREIEVKGLDYSPELYRKMADLGHLGLMVPETYGGTGGNWVDMAIFYEEAGRALLPSPHFSTVVMGGQAILALGTEEQKRHWLPRIAGGQAVVSLALTEPEAGENLKLLSTRAVRRGDQYLIEGTKLFVSHAHRADALLTAAKIDNNVALLVVEGKSANLTCSPMETLGGERPCEVVFSGVSVPSSNLLGKPDGGQALVDILEKAKLMICASLVGSAQVALEMAIDYSKLREQFGRPIGTFQALQHKMANMAVALDAARWTTYYAAWMNSQGLPAARETAMAQLQVGEACRWVTAEALQVHGGMGAMEEHDVGLYFRRAKAGQLQLGPRDVQCEAIAQSLGL